METMCVSHQINPLKNKLLIVRSLTVLDKFLEEKFSTIQLKYNKSLLEDVSSAYQNVRDAIEKHDYERVAREMNILKSSDDVDEHFFETNKRILNEGIQDLIAETEDHVRMIDGDLEMDRIESTVENLKLIQKAKSTVSEYLDTPNQIDQCIQNVKSNIENSVKLFFHRVQALVNIDNIYEVDQKLISINLASNLLKNLCDKWIFDEIKLIKQNQERVIMDEIVQKYSDIDLSKYALNPPTYIFIKLEEAAKTNELYKKALDKIKNNIFGKFRNELELAKKEICLNLNSSHIRMVDAALRYLPDTMKKILQEELKYAKDDINDMIEDKNNELKKAIDNGNVKVIKNLLEKYQNSENMKSFANQGRTLILKQVESIVEKIKEHFGKDEVSEALADVKEFCQYKSELETIIIAIQRSYLTVHFCVETQFQTARNSFCSQFVRTNISEITEERIKSIEKSFLCLIEFVKFCDNEKSYDKPKLIDMLPHSFYEQLEGLNSETLVFFTKLQKKYTDGLDEINITSLKDILDFMQKCYPFLQKIRTIIQSYDFSHTAVYSMMNIMSNMILYPCMLQSISERIQKLRDEIIAQQLINDETRESSSRQCEYYRKLNIKLLILDQVELLSKHDLGFDVKTVKQTCLKSIEEKITAIYSNMEDFLTKFFVNKDLATQNYDDFDFDYCHLSSIRKNITRIDFTIDDSMNKINNKIINKIVEWGKTVEEESSIENIYKSLIRMKQVSNSIPSMKSTIDKKIDKVLSTYKNRTKTSRDFSELYMKLIQDNNRQGYGMIADHKAFQCYASYVFNEKTKKSDIASILKTLKGDAVDTSQLREKYNIFQAIYQDLIKSHQTHSNPFDSLISDAKLIAGNIQQISEDIQWNANLRGKIPTVLAYICALWTFKKAEDDFENETAGDRGNYFFKPHAAQVVSILRMLGIGDKNEKLENNLVQIGAGEGKSITLGLTAALLAILGFDVYCSCYSQYLSQRDYNAFLSLFDALGVTKFIHYGTWNKLCEDTINQNGEIRQIVEQIISTNSLSAVQSIQHIERAKILLIDELDVFFSQDFYGNLHTSLVNLRDPTITSLINFIWTQRNDELSLNRIKDTNEYKNCCKTFPNWETLIDEAIKDLIYDVKNFECHDYIVKEDKIGYKEQDSVVYNMTYGYKTLFAYFYEYEKGKITKKSLEERISLKIKCGSFSYVEILLQFHFILGVTGTLENLDDFKKSIIEKTYKIRKKTFIPSIFGQTNLTFTSSNDIMIENRDEYFNRINSEIDNKLTGSSEKRAILIFFESKQKLEEFYQSKAFETKQSIVTILREEENFEEKEKVIRRATVPGQITLFTRTFGRGTDFIRYDQSVSTNGGIHVIQTFLSEDCSEEIQIKGRTARQDDKGSYSMILLDNDLEKFFTEEKDIENLKKNKEIQDENRGVFRRKNTTKTLYDILNDRRNSCFKIQYENNTGIDQRAKERHKATQEFLKYLNAANIDSIRAFLIKENNGTNIVRSQSRIICLIDGTSSMIHLLQNCKNTIETIFDRTRKILRENNINEDSFQIQFVVYRNYNSTEDKILQYSPWEMKADNLRAFMNTIKVERGWNNEAIEIGLWHANKENEREKITQVILIGDASPNTKDEVKQKRSYLGEDYWKKTKFSQETHYEDELAKLISKEIPVHTVFVAKRAQDIFNEIADQTAGECKHLDINSPSRTNMLIDLVTGTILQNVGGNLQGKTLADAYRKQFGKCYK
ncbi:unnamed protein product [Rotaria sp. Silwood2]|nr:unnamed protein product [Rotaria sp. Silwood2]